MAKVPAISGGKDPGALMRHPVVSGELAGEFQARQTLRRTMHWHCSLSDDLVERLWQSPDSVMASATPLQDKERCLVVRITDGTEPLVLKRQNWGGAWKTFCKSLRTPQARQSFFDGIHLVEHGVRTPRPLALVEQRLGPFGIQSYLLTEHIAGTSLYRLMRFEQPSLEGVEHLADQVARLCTQLDDLRVSHNDLKPENLLIDPTNQIWLIDLEKMRRHNAVQPARTRLLEDLNRLLHARNWRENRMAAEIFRDRLLRTPAVSAALAAARTTHHPLVDSGALDRGAENRLSVIVVDPGSPQQLQECVESFRDFADEWLVAGADAADNASKTTIDEANRALAAARHPWVLVVRGNERVSPDLAKEIPCLLTAGPKSDACRIELRRVVLGRAIRYGAWRGNASVRLARKQTAAFVINAGQVELQSSSARVEPLKSKLMLPFDWQGETFDHQFRDETSRLAELRRNAGRRANLSKAIARAIGNFARSYLLRCGFLDGRAGLHLSLLTALHDITAEMKLSIRSTAPEPPKPIDVRETRSPSGRRFDRAVPAANHRAA